MSAYFRRINWYAIMAVSILGACLLLLDWWLGTHPMVWFLGGAIWALLLDDERRWQP